MKVHLTLFRAFVVIVSIIFPNTTYGQPETLWTKTFGGGSYDRGYCVQQTSDGGYILTGSTSSYGAGGADVWLIKTDASGDTLWTKTFGGTDYDYGNSVQQTSDGGYIIIGSTESYGLGEMDAWLIKTDSSGDTLWTKTYGGNNEDGGISVQQTSDGGYVLACYTESYGSGYSDFWLIKTDADGDTLWTRTYGGNNSEGCKSVQQTSDGGYIIAGSTESYGLGEMDAWLIKTDSSGDTLWTKTYGGDSDDRCLSVCQTSDGGYILTGSTSSYGAGGADVWLVKADTSGRMVWGKTYGGSGYDRGKSVEQITDGGYIIVGYNKSINDGAEDTWLIKTNASGDTVWTKSFGLFGSKGYSIQQNSDGGYIITGSYIDNFASHDDVLLILIAPDTGSVLIENDLKIYPNLFLLNQNYPNPFNPVTTISYQLPKSNFVQLSIYNITGQLIETLVNGHNNAGYHTVLWNASEVGSGLYFYRIEAGEYTETKKCLILK